VGMSIGVWWLGPIFIGIYPIALVIAYAFAGLVLGRWGFDRLGWAHVHTAWALLVGITCLAIASQLPAVGLVVSVVAITYGLGALTLLPRMSS
jgi:hypothetical protein